MGPLPLEEAVTLFGAASFRWWVSGEHTRELHLDRSWRTHDDTDVRAVLPALTPQRQALLRSFLPDDHPWQGLFDRISS